MSIVALAAAETAAAPPPKLLIEAQLDKNRITVGEEAQVTVVAQANGVNLPDYALPAVPGLKIMRVANSQSFSWVNGRLARSTTSVFLVSATAPGRYTIPPVRIVSGGASAQTQPLVLDVGAAGSTPVAPGPSGAPSPEASIPRVWGDQSLPELFVRLVVDRRRVYWNQQVTARFILYARERLDEVPMWEVAEANGFWKTALGDLRRGRVRVGNNDYVAYEQDVAYFPTRTGRLTLGPGRIEVRVARSVPAPDPFSLLGLPETQVETVPLQTENATIDVMPLPGSPPPTFRGAVGRLAMDVKVDRLVAHAGEPVTVTTVLHGRGNLNTAGDPDVEATLPLRTFEAPGAVTTRDAGLDVSGERRHDKAFVPEVPGSFAIEPIRFTWFDPEEGRFRTQFSDSIRIRVVPGGGSTAAAAGPSEPPAAPRHRLGPRGELSLGPPPGAVA
ncbi:MAG: BatD family protein, partial [Bacteroidota bacterium]